MKSVPAISGVEQLRFCVEADSLSIAASDTVSLHAPGADALEEAVAAGRAMRLGDYAQLVIGLTALLDSDADQGRLRDMARLPARCIPQVILEQYGGKTGIAQEVVRLQAGAECRRREARSIMGQLLLEDNWRKEPGADDAYIDTTVRYYLEKFRAAYGNASAQATAKRQGLHVRLGTYLEGSLIAPESGSK